LHEFEVVRSFLKMGVYTAPPISEPGWHSSLRRARRTVSVALAIFDGGPSDTAALLIEKTGSFDLAILVAGGSLLVGVAAYRFLLQERGVTLFPLDVGTCGSA